MKKRRAKLLFIALLLLCLACGALLVDWRGWYVRVRLDNWDKGPTPAGWVRAPESADWARDENTQRCLVAIALDRKMSYVTRTDACRAISESQSAVSAASLVAVAQGCRRSPGRDDQLVLIAAIGYLRKCRGDGVALDLTKAVATDPAEALGPRRMAAWALAAHLGQNAREPIMSMLMTEADPKVRDNLETVLRYLDEYGVVTDGRVMVPD